jgi:hypothetical protein
VLIVSKPLTDKHLWAVFVLGVVAQKVTKWAFYGHLKGVRGGNENGDSGC